MSKIELPPLPPVVAHMHSTGEVCTERKPEVSSWPVDLVAAPDLSARDRQIVELCASLADDAEAGDGSHDYNAGAETMREKIAAAIRALLDEKKENE